MSDYSERRGPDCPQPVLPHVYKELLARHNALENTLANINVHFDMLCTHELRQHGFVSPDHDIDFQVFRVLCGYKELMEVHNVLVEAVAWEMECRGFTYKHLTLAGHKELFLTSQAARAEVDRLMGGE